MSESKLEISPTPEQEAIVSAAGGPDSLMVRAYAGAAKTTTLQLAAPQVKVPALALAFNRKIAEELKPRLPGQFVVRTLNGLGHQAWARSIPGQVSVKLDDRKLGKLVTQIASERRVELANGQWDSLRQLVSGAMQAGLVPKDAGHPLVADTPEAWEDIASGLWIDKADAGLLIDLARDVLEESNRLARQGLISFDDQVYCPVVLGGAWPQFPVLFVDEAQDLSPLNHAMIRLASRPDAKLVVVGDPRQAIYAFRGADSKSMDTLGGLRPEWVRLPLATTFRCPKAIVARQQEHAPGFKAWHTNIEGRVERFPTAEVGGWNWQRLAGLGAGPAVLCRTNAPLMSLAFKLIRRGIGPVMLGRDIGKGLIGLTKKIAARDDTSAESVMAGLRDWQDREESLARANQAPDSKLESIADRAECIRAVLEGSGCRDAGELRAMLARLFEKVSGQVTLSSIHRAKGLEWPVVMHLDPWRIPSKSAKAAAARGDPSGLEQEYNLQYVAETRTKDILVLANLEDFR